MSHGSCDAPRPGDTEVSAEWISNVLRENKIIGAEESVREAVVTDLKGNRGLTGAISKLVLTYAGDCAGPTSMILKMTTEGNRKSDSAREGMFYQNFQEEFSAYLPRVLYSHADMSERTSVILMSNLKETNKGTDVNFLFGNQIWGVPDGVVDDSYPDQLAVLEEMFLAAAEWNAKYWNDESLKQQKWLKSVPWYNGEDQQRWEHAIQRSKDAWIKCKSKLDAGEGSFTMNEKLRKIIDLSFDNSSWEALQDHLQSTDIPFTLCHGDFHAANMFFNKEKPHLRIYDWSEIGLWEPCADLGQTVISDIRPSVWLDEDVKILRKYWEKLIELGVSADEFPFEKCLEGYQRAPIERWIWVFCILFNYGLPDCATQYFHDQLLAFVEKHGGDREFYVLKPVVALS